jgi:glucose/arabinose dehydrogenase
MIVLGALLAFGGLASAQTPRLEKVAEGFTRPLYLTHAPDDSQRLFVMEQGGRIITLEAGQRAVFLDIRERVSRAANSPSYTEQGLLGLAFHPDYAENRVFFLNYTDRGGGTVIARYRASADGRQADPASEEILFTLPQPFANHNGGHIAFGPDGYLYVSLGDGGAANDPLGAGQNLTLLLGKILRLEVGAQGPYSVPADNPFVDDPAAADEIWAYGLRNVWRFSFDRLTGDLYMGDVGQNRYEEINFHPASSRGGENYGWNAYEASTVFNRGVVAPNAVAPILEYDHAPANGCSVTGGYVYRGQAIASLIGRYIYGDFCSGRVWMGWREGAAWRSQVLLDSGLQISSFGEDAAGELYVVDYRGAVYRLVP